MKALRVGQFWMASVGVLLTGAVLAAATSAQSTPARGAQLFAQCAACHTIDKGGEAGIGPNLWGVYRSKAAAMDDFGYSPALTKSRLVWDDATLDKWLAGPSKLVPHSMMAYPGMKNPADRQAIIAYLKSKSR